MQYVRKVEIDVAIICSGYACMEHSSEFSRVNIGPLVKAMWLPSAAKASFEFVRSYARPSDGRLREADLLQVFDIETTNKLLEHLRTDTDDLKKYSRQIVALKTWLFPNIPRNNLDGIGYIELGRSGRNSDDNQVLTLSLRKKKDGSRGAVRMQALHLRSLPTNVRKQICRGVIVSDKDICVDLSTRNKPDVLLGLFPIKDFVHGRILREIFWSENRFTFRMRSNKTPTSFGGFGALERLICYEREIGWKKCQWAGPMPDSSEEEHGKIQIELDFDKTAAATLSDVRIDIAALLRSTSFYCGELIDFRICLGLDAHDGVLEEQSTISLSALRVNTATMLSQVRKKYPDVLSATKFAFYIDGHGALTSIEVHRADELQVFRDDAFQSVDGVSLSCLEDNQQYSYDGTLQCWVRYLEQMAAGQSSSAWRYLHKRHFSVLFPVD